MIGNARRGDAKLLATLLSGATVEQAAAAASISPATAFRRLKEPGFRAALSEAQGELVSRTVAVLASSAAAAAESLSHLARNAESEGARVSAAKAVLDQLRAFRDQGELEDRLAKLEGVVIRAE